MPPIPSPLARSSSAMTLNSSSAETSPTVITSKRSSWRARPRRRRRPAPYSLASSKSPAIVTGMMVVRRSAETRLAAAGSPASSRS